MSSEAKLSCWKCAQDLKDIPRPFSRFAECPACRCELHVCRMCRHYNPRYTGDCDHDIADKVLDKDKSNFCSYFKPRFGLSAGEDIEGKKQAQHELNQLFGESSLNNSQGSDEVEQEQSNAEKARSELDDLFNS